MYQLLTTTTEALNANIQRYDSLKEQADLKDKNTKIVEEDRIKLRRMVEVYQYKMSRLADRLQVTQREKADWKDLFARAQHQLDI